MRASLMALLMLSVSLAGCLESGNSLNNGPGDPDLSAPAEWQIGQWWLYTFSTPDWEDDSARLVVAEDDAVVAKVSRGPVSAQMHNVNALKVRGMIFAQMRESLG